MKPILALTLDFDTVSKFFNYFGFPLIFIFGVGYVVRKIFLWVQPWVEKGFAAFVDRQNRVAASHEMLATKTVEIQEKAMQIHQDNSSTLKALEQKMPMLCRIPPLSPPPKGQ